MDINDRVWMQVQREHGSRRAIKREDEVTDGDGVVTMKAHEKKNVMERFACKWAYGCKTW